MQNLPVTATTIVTSPATSTQASTPTDNNSAMQAAEPFGNVLARQQANAGAPPNNQKPDSKKPTASAANDASATATGNVPTTQPPTLTPDTSSMLAALLPATAVTNSPATKDKTDPHAPAPNGVSTLHGDMLAMTLPTAAVTNSPATKDKTDPQAPVPNGVSTLPSDMLAMMLPTTVVTNSPATKDKTDPQAPVPNGVSTLPGDMLAMMLPSTVATSRTVANGKGLQEPITNEGKKAQTQPIAAAALGATLQSVENKVVSEASGTSGASALLGAQGNTKLEATATGVNTSKDNTFAAALGILSKDGAKTAQLDTSAMKISAQPVASAAPDSLLQSGIAPIVASQSGVTQAAQAVINTPVTDQAWGNEFNQKITWMATQHEQTAELHLNPPNLGPLDVVLKVSGDQATALFTSPHAAVRDAVQQALPQLRDMLAGNGITLGNATVSDQSPKDQQAWQANQQQKGNGSTAGTIDATVTTGVITSGSSVSLGRHHQGMVDTFA